MKKRVAQKILKYREKLTYSEPQIKKAEETLEGIEKRSLKRESIKTEPEAETEA